MSEVELVSSGGAAIVDISPVSPAGWATFLQVRVQTHSEHVVVWAGLTGVERKMEVGVRSEPEVGVYTTANMYVETQWMSVTVRGERESRTHTRTHASTNAATHTHIHHLYYWEWLTLLWNTIETVGAGMACPNSTSLQ